MNNISQKGILYKCLYETDSVKKGGEKKIERSRRTNQKMFYNRRKFKIVSELRQVIEQWNINYNNLEHCGLGGKTPNEILLINPPNVCV